MAIVELAMVVLKPHVSSSNSYLQSALSECMQALNNAPGGTSFAFRPQVKDDPQSKSRICLLGGWQTVEQHADFLTSGQSAALVAKIAPYVELEGVFHVFLDVGKIDLDSDVIEAGIYTVGTGKRGDVEKVVQKGDGNVIGGWKARKEEKGMVGQAIEFVKEQLGQDTGAEKEGTVKEEVEPEIFVSFSTARDKEAEVAFRQRVLALGAELEVVKLGRFEK